VRQYALDGWDVIACCRQPSQAPKLNAIAAASDGHVRVEQLDVLDGDRMESLGRQLRGQAIDVLINNAGIIGPRRGPGQSFGNMHYGEWMKVLATNTFAPMKMSEVLVEQVEASDQKKIVTISSTIGSNAETFGSAYAYASSKAAVNMVMTTMAHDLKERGITVAVLCPGNVKTDMGGPDANVTLEDSVAGMRQRIAELSLKKTGTFTRYNGEAIGW
jgi:NAD(P)-dependent dehydrogenase (short-subunit alcohol dehydrogenase family)